MLEELKSKLNIWSSSW